MCAAARSKNRVLHKVFWKEDYPLGIMESVAEPRAKRQSLPLALFSFDAAAAAAAFTRPFLSRHPACILFIY